VPVTGLLFLGLLGAVLALLVRDALPPYPYAIFALSLHALLLATPLLSELGLVLRRDEGGEWIEALPARPGELALARTLHFLALVLCSSLALLVPFALLGRGLPALARLGLPLAGFALALPLAALLVWAQRLLLERVPAALVALQTGLVISSVVGLLFVLGRLPELAGLTPPAGDSPLGWLPPLSFASPLAGAGGPSWLAPLVTSAVSLLLLVAVPARPLPTRIRRGGPLSHLFEPLRVLTSGLVRRDERGSFDLVFDALPREREVVLRTYPLLGIPLAFLWAGARAQRQEGAWQDLLALLLFTVGIYLPLLLAHVPLAESHRASWILRTAPVSRGAIDAGAVKALFARFLLPLFLGLALLALALAGVEIVLRLWLPALTTALVLLLLLYPRCVPELPLSVAPGELRGRDQTGLLLGLAVLLTLAAVAANRFLGLAGAALATLALLGAAAVQEHRIRSRE
jgi:hypothetical protein